MRWGATKFVQNQARFAADNTYDEDALPSVDQWNAATLMKTPDELAELTTNLLLEMIKPAFPSQISVTKRKAILKRTSVFLTTADFVYLRLAGNKQPVERYCFSEHWISKCAEAMVHKHNKTGVKRDEDEYHRLLNEEEVFMSECLDTESHSPESSVPHAPETAEESQAI